MPEPRFQDDPELIRRCIDGDAAAWDLLVDRYRLLVYAVPSRHGLRPEECDDVFQAVFLALLKNVASLRDHSALAKWLIVAAARESARLRSGRASGARGGAEQIQAMASHEAAPQAELESLERRHRVWAAMERLEPRCRDLLTALFGRPGRPDYGAVSRELGIPMGSIGPSRARCLARLIELIRE